MNTSHTIESDEEQRQDAYKKYQLSAYWTLLKGYAQTPWYRKEI